MKDNLKEVYFNEYCKTCEHELKKEDETPCDECLSNPVNNYSHKPVKWNKKTKQETHGYLRLSQM